jgi:RNA polymerase sigma factor (TIGR02999 family)
MKDTRLSPKTQLHHTAMDTAPDVTRLLNAARGGNKEAVDELFGAVYDRLHILAGAQRNRWEGDFTLNTTALVHEAYVKMVKQPEADWKDRAHFYSAAARAMRHVLVNYAQRRQATKRGGGTERVSLDVEAVSEKLADFNPVPPDAAEEVLSLHDALTRLESVSERQSRVVELRFFSGMRARETAEVLGVSVATVKRDWGHASAWLRREMDGPVAT